jgi:hypothetical protein
MCGTKTFILLENVNIKWICLGFAMSDCQKRHIIIFADRYNPWLAKDGFIQDFHLILQK